MSIDLVMTRKLLGSGTAVQLLSVWRGRASCPASAVHDVSSYIDICEASLVCIQDYPVHPLPSPAVFVYVGVTALTLTTPL